MYSYGLSLFCTVSVTRGSRARLRGQARPSAVFRVGRPSCTSTHTGTPWIVPSRRKVATWQKFLSLSSCSPRPSIFVLIRSRPFLARSVGRASERTRGRARRLLQLSLPDFRVRRTSSATRWERVVRRLVAAEPGVRIERRDLVQRGEFAVVELKAHPRLPA